MTPALIMLVVPGLPSCNGAEVYYLKGVIGLPIVISFRDRWYTHIFFFWKWAHWWRHRHRLDRFRFQNFQSPGSVEWNHFGNFGRGYPTEHSCKIISKSIHWFKRRLLLSKLLTDKKTFKGFSIFSSGSHLIHPSRMVWAILVEGHPKNIPVKLFWNWASGLEGDVILRFFYF